MPTTPRTRRTRPTAATTRQPAAAADAAAAATANAALPGPAVPPPPTARTTAAADNVPRRVPTGRAAVREAQPDRQLNILLAAEKLFAQHGFHGVSIRDIATEAGVQLALVYYYFGSKNDLYHAIFESWSGTIESRRAQLDRVTADRRAPDLPERIIEAFIGPVIALANRPEGRYYALMAARDLAAPTPEADRAQHEFFDPMAHAFIDALQLAAPKATRGEVAWCYQFMLGALTHFLSDQRVERLSHGENRPGDPAAQPRLLAFLAAGFRGALGLPALAAAQPAPAARRPARAN